MHTHRVAYHTYNAEASHLVQHLIVIKVQTCIAAHAIYAASATLYITDMANIQPRLQPKPHALTLACILTAIHSPGLLINCIYSCNPSNYMDWVLIYRHHRDGRLSWPSWLTCSGQFIYKPANHGHSTGQGMFVSQRSTSYPLSHDANQSNVQGGPKIGTLFRVP